MEEEKYKIFVGNVPYYCTTKEFQNCFKHFDGYVKAEVIGDKNSLSLVSKGFGYVIFQNQEKAQKVMKQNIILKHRILRLTKYDENQKYKNDTNQIFITDLPDYITKEKLMDILEECGKIEECNIYKSGNKINSVITFNSKEGYMKAVKEDIYLGKNRINILPFKRKRYAFKRSEDSLYQAGFKAGRIIGFQQGFQEGIKFQEQVN